MTVERLDGGEWQISHVFLSLKLKELHQILISQMRDNNRCEHVPLRSLLVVSRVLFAVALQKRNRCRMSHNTFGHLLRVTTWGESHGNSIGCVVDGCPPQIPFSEEDIQSFLDRRTKRRTPSAAALRANRSVPCTLTRSTKRSNASDPPSGTC